MFEKEFRVTECSRRAALFAGGAACAALAVPGVAKANGDVFFEALEIEGDPQFVYYGSVKDKAGNYISGALVAVDVSEPQLTYESYTNMLGRFRSLDVGRVVQNLGYKINPNAIDVRVFAPGYKTVRKLSMRRSRDTLGAFEINFVLEKEKNEAG
jgi:hypothetical protein